MNTTDGDAATGLLTPTVTESPATPGSRNIEVHVAGDVTGELVVGDNNLLVHADHGALVNVLQGTLRVQRRPVPVLLPPRPFRELLGRTTEVAAARATLQVDQPFEFYAAPGWGKTAMLRYLGPLAAGSYADGMVYQPAAGQPLADLLQFLFDAFYEVNVPFKPSTGQLRQYLQPIRALVLLDDLELMRDELDALLTYLPQGVLLLAAKERTLWGTGQAQSVSGLSKEPGLALFERELGRRLTPAEQPAFDRLYSAVAGNPLDLIEGAALMRDKADAFTGLIGAQPTVTSASLVGAVVSQTSEDERKVLGLLASVYDAALPASHVAAITGIPGSPANLARLSAAGLAEMQDGGYRLKKEPVPALAQTVAPDQWTEPTIRHFAAWAGSFAGYPRLILEAADPLLKVLDLASETQRHWPEVLQLARALERPLAQAARWGAWQRTLNRSLQAAHALKDRATEAWALHQLGTRSLCLGEWEAAKTSLNQALAIRRSLGDREGVQATQHNLDRLQALIAPPKPPGGGDGGRPVTGLVIKALAVLVAVAVALIGGPAAVHAVFGGQVTLEPSDALNAGTVSVGKSNTTELRIHNTGRGDLVLLGIPAPAGEFQQSNNCPAAPNKLKAGATCTVEIRFLPTRSGVRTGELVVTEQGGDTRQVQLTGTGTAPKITLAGGVEFGPQPAGILSAAKEVSLRNDGNESLSIKTVAISGDFRLAGGDFRFTPDCPESLPAGQVCRIGVQIFPATTGVRTGTLTITDGLGTQTVDLRGTGIMTFSLSPSPVDFGKVLRGGFADKVVTITNTAGLPLSISDIRTSTKDFSTAGNCVGGVAIPPQGSCWTQVRFTPLAAGTRTDTLVVMAASGDQQQDSLTGVGVVPALSFKPGVLDFGGKSGDLPLTVINQSQSGVDLGPVTIDSGSSIFGIVADTCSKTSLKPGASCSLRVRYEQSGNLLRTPPDICSQLRFVDETPSSPQFVRLIGSGKCPS